MPTSNLAANLAANLAELNELEQILTAGAPYLDARIACEVAVEAQRFPVYVVTMGNPDPAVPAVGYFGGIHGLERIGAAVVLAYLQSLVARLRWDSALHKQLESTRLVFMPIVNPGGIWRGTRSNPNGVDLMRNAPLEALERVPPMLGGQRIGPALPWFRGAKDAPMEAESQAVCRIVAEELLSHPFSLAVDCHSGFGVHDRIWFPYAYTAEPIEHLAEAHALKTIYDAAYHHHNYIFEPQSRHYLTHGDLWDFLYLQSLKRAESTERIFLPLTLEMGSWLWIRKNPRQLFSRLGIFNPLIDHRQQRVLRRHLSWLDFLLHAAGSHRRWLPSGEQRAQHRDAALALWYREPHD
ncbi:MAG TPA: M14 family zinc carboxypeptidase [Rhodocyclaceae bacterium]|nr:M14 family zinc carboxypeptidase [Rhodocyclaceae bacterium]